MFFVGFVSFGDASSIPGASTHNIVVRDGGKGGGCPPVWTQVKSELNTKFMTGNQCNSMARAAIRATFHDCRSWDTSQRFHGGCDGSLIVGTKPDVELNRAENRGLQDIAGVLQEMAGRYGTSVADMIVFAGSKYCPQGWKVDADG